MKFEKEEVLIIVFIVFAIIATVFIVKPYVEAAGAYSTMGICKAQEVLNELE